MSPLNRGSPLGPRGPPAGVRSLPPPRFGRLVPHGIPRFPPPINPVFGGPMRQRQPPMRPAGVPRPNGLMPLFPGPRARGMALPIMPPMRLRGAGMVRGPLMPRRIPVPPMMPAQMIPPMVRPIRSRFPVGNGNVKGKTTNNTKKVSKLEELELKKPWMTDEIRTEIQKKNKLYAKAKKNKDAVEWEEFKDLRNKVTRMIRDAKTDYLTKHPEQAHLHPDDGEPYDERDEDYVSSEDDTSYYCEICDRDLPTEDAFTEHKSTHKICGLEGCTFSAHPLLVDKHIKMQHSTGLYQRMKNLSTPEDIEKWLTERKRRYPTKANIALHKAEELEKSQRGEVIKRDVKTKAKRTMNAREKKRNPRKRHTRETNNNFRKDEIYRGLRPFPGTGVLQQKDSNEICLDEDERESQTDQREEISGNISDEDYVEQPCTATNLSVLKPTNLSILSLVANYGSETDEDEAPEEMPIKRIKMEDIESSKATENNTVCEETPNVQAHTDRNSQLNKQTKVDNISRYSNTKCDKKHEKNEVVRNKPNDKALNRHNKLLYKLLSRSIQHERNLICQCLKYIVDNNFFD